ncbi:MAG: DUF5916 domain-containing protein [Xanthomarina gelatinilytica]|uniref:carbohydrate binding family 9 domain-containing protein n=1 Tax=Xanthomarina gelatinilytica TaxID=1137281 RepID=UPI003A838131
MKYSNEVYTALNLFFILLSTVDIIAQNQIKIPQIDRAININGELNDAEWGNAIEFKDFKQLTPDLGEMPTEKTSAKILYDNQFLYVGATMNYNNSSDIYGRTLERDVSLSRDDYVEIHLDTYNDNTNTLVFRTNIFAAREDYEVGRNGETINYSWNMFWDVSTKVYENKWTAEFRIPFSSLRFKENENTVMRFKAVAFYKLKNEKVISTLNELIRTPQVYQYKNSEEIIFSNIKPTEPLYITPYIKADYTSRYILNETQSAYVRQNNLLQENGYSKSKTIDKILSNIGVDVKYKPNSNNIIDLTLNTDFAEVESDDRIINVTRFPIFLPEKRLFFLENQDIFSSDQFDHRLFFSRRIGINNGLRIPIIAGIRFTGSSSKWQYGAMSLQTHSVEADNLPTYNMSTARVKRIIGKKGSYIGFLSTSKFSNNDFNYLFAFDSNIRFTENIRSRFTFGSTFDKEKGNWKPYYGLDINTFKANGFGINYRFREYTEDFNPELGFVARPNTKRITLNHGWRKTFVEHKWLRYISFGNYVTKNWLSSNGNHDLSQINMYIYMAFKNGLSPGLIGPIYQEDNLYTAWNISDNISIPLGSYKMWRLNPEFSTGNAFPYILNLESEFGDYYGGNQFTFSGNFIYDFSKLFTVEIGANYNKLKFPITYVTYGNNILELSRYYSRLKFSFSSKSFLNSYVQYDSDSQKLGWNLRFRFTPKEGTNLYIVYNQNINTERNRLIPTLPAFESQGLIFKFSKTFIQ